MFGESRPARVRRVNFMPLAARAAAVKVLARPCGARIAGPLPEGCRLCEQGAKMVLFVTGLCSFHCFYCPVSDEKMYRDGVFANERSVRSDEDVLAEARAMGAAGAGITGGDPLEVPDRVAHYIDLLKGEFGKGFHTHLYTMTADLARIRTVAAGGLDEIRFHPPPGMWARMEASGFPAAVKESRRLGVAVGLEVPLIPDRLDDLKRMIAWAEGERLDFVNLNELEYSDANYARLGVRDYRRKAEMAYGVTGCDAGAEEILRSPHAITVHYCTSAYKDGWQLRERIKRAAEHVAQPWDVVTEDGTLIKGIVIGDDLEAILGMLRRHRVAADLMSVNPGRKRVEVAAWVLERLAGRLDAECFVVEEYPTADGLEVGRQRLP